VKDSIEERILELQRRKAKIATAALGSPGSDTSDPRPSLDDFKLLFQDR
jgi:SNF2 family DNA or RNA helicase